MTKKQIYEDQYNKNEEYIKKLSEICSTLRYILHSNISSEHKKRLLDSMIILNYLKSSIENQQNEIIELMKN